MPLLKLHIFLIAFSISACSSPTPPSSPPSFCATNTSDTSTATLCHQPGVIDSSISFRHQYNNLSSQLHFELSYIHLFDNLSINKHYWRIKIKTQTQNRLYEVIDTTGWFSNRYIDSKDVRSYSTGVNQNHPVIDNSYGHFVVADFNFDKREDFAIMHDIGGISGPYYSFYIQQDHHIFVEDHFLSDSVRYFPSKIDAKKNRIHTKALTGNIGVQERIYTYQPKTKQWQNHAYTLH